MDPRYSGVGEGAAFESPSPAALDWVFPKEQHKVSAFGVFCFPLSVQNLAERLSFGEGSGAALCAEACPERAGRVEPVPLYCFGLPANCQLPNC
jgi:hypothetical protein